MSEYGNFGGPGRSNLRNPVKRALEDSLIREYKTRNMMRRMGLRLPSNDMRIERLKRQLGYH